MTVGELIEILEMFDSDQEVMISEDGIKSRPVKGVDGVRKVRKTGEHNQNISEESFVSINGR